MRPMFRALQKTNPRCKNPRAVRAGLELVEAVAALKALCLYRPVSALRPGSLSSAKVAGSEAENVIKIRKGGRSGVTSLGSPV